MQVDNDLEGTRFVTLHLQLSSSSHDLSPNRIDLIAARELINRTDVSVV